MSDLTNNAKDSNILNSLMTLVTPERIARLSEFLGDTPQSVRTALSSAAPFILRGISRFGSIERGAEELMEFIRRFDLQTTDPNQVMDRALDTSAVGTEIANSSQALIEKIFGGRMDGLLETLSSKAGISYDTVRRLSVMLVPLTLTLIARKVQAAGGGISWLTDFLAKQEVYAKAALPSGLLTMLGAKGSADSHTAPPSRSSSAGLSSWWVPLIAVAGLVLAGLWLYNRADRGNPGRIEQRAMMIEGDAATFDETALSEDNRRLHQTILIMQPGDDPRTVTYKEITFQPGTAQLAATAMPVVNEIATLLKQFPATKIHLIGHTDATGTSDENLDLSLARAVTVRSHIIDKGIIEDRITVVGKGALEPLVAEDTEEARALNRRIEIVVIRGEDSGIAH